MKVSIVITAYNVEQYIRQAVLSALNQKHIPSDQPDWQLEVVVVNDASTDGTADILSELQCSNGSMVRVITNPQNVGAGMSRKIGIQASTGDYILLLDGDDLLQPTFIASLAYSAQKYDADIVSGGITILRDEKIGYFDQTCYGNFVATGTKKLTNFYKERIVFMNNKLIRRRLHELVPYCERRYIEDTPVIARMLWYANKVVYTNNPGYIYRMQPQSLTHKASKFKNALFSALCAMEVVEFFRDKEPELQELFGIGNFLIEVNNMNQNKPTDKEITLYANEIRKVYNYWKEHQNEINNN